MSNLNEDLSALHTPIGRVWPLLMKSREGVFIAPAKVVLRSGRVLTGPKHIDRRYQVLPLLRDGRIVYALPGGGEIQGATLPASVIAKYQISLQQFKDQYDATEHFDSAGESQ
jgi:hypothetical protein